MIESYQNEFIEFLINNNAMRFGEFTLKSGRISPYFINTGSFFSGSAVVKLAEYYSAAIMQNKLDDLTVVFGPAYKGIPLSVSITSYFAEHYNKDISYLFDRKEAKDHGEFSGEFQSKNHFVGKIPDESDNVVLVDDVMTTGGTKYEAVELLRQLGDFVRIKGLVISVNRKEVDKDGNDPVTMFVKKTGIPVVSIIDITTIIEYLDLHKDTYGKYLDAVRNYREKWGVK